MTNSVEQLIIKGKEEKKLTYAENKAYMFYYEIWKFLLYIKDSNFDFIRVTFSYKQDGEYGYLNKENGIRYTKFRDNAFVQYNNYYEGCVHHYINILFNTNIDMDLFFKLISLDGFVTTINKTGNSISVYTDITKMQLQDKIEEALLKNKILIKNKRG